MSALFTILICITVYEAANEPYLIYDLGKAIKNGHLTPIKLTVSDHTYKFCRYENSEKIVNINEYEAEEDIGDFILQGAEIYEEIINKIKEETTNE